jgi:hypothetical protein
VGSRRCPNCGRVIHGDAKCAFCPIETLGDFPIIRIYPRSRDLTRLPRAGPSQQSIDADRALALAETAALVYVFSSMWKATIGSSQRGRRRY